MCARAIQFLTGNHRRRWNSTRPECRCCLRHYLKLGGRLLGFNLDPDFSDVIDGLIVVDLTRTEPRLLERYLGKDEAAQFMRHHDTLTGATLS